MPPEKAAPEAKAVSVVLVALAAKEVWRLSLLLKL